MRIERRPLIRARPLTSLLLTFSFVAASVSGVALYLRPEGMLARWSGWSLLGLDKKQWENVHIAYVTVLLVAGLIHIAFNLRALVTYLRGKVGAAVRSGLRVPIAKECLASLVVIALVFWGTMASRQPLRALGELRGAIKDGRYSARVQPPCADADKLTVAELCKCAGLPEPQALEHARLAGIDIRDPNSSVSAVAKRQRLSPEMLYVFLLGHEGRSTLPAAYVAREGAQPSRP